MLAFTDEGLAYLTLAAGRVSPRKRGRWLREIGEKLDPPPVTDISGNLKSRAVRSSAAVRQARVRARRKNGQHVYKLEIADLAMEGLLEMMLRMGRLTQSEALDHGCIETALARLLEEQGARWSR